MATASSSCCTDVLWSSDRNAAVKALVGIAFGYRDTFVSLLCRDIVETVSTISEQIARVLSSRVKRDVAYC